jgi:hypothetical protein
MPTFNRYHLAWEHELCQLHHPVKDLARATEDVDTRRDDDFRAKALASHLLEDQRRIMIEGDDAPNPLVAQLPPFAPKPM